MDFKVFLETAGYTVDAYSKADPAVQSFLQAAFAATVERMGRVANDGTNHTLSRQWNDYFAEKTHTLLSEATAPNAKSYARGMETESLKRSDAIFGLARKSAASPEQLVFLEAAAMNVNTHMEALERCIPVGSNFERIFREAQENMKPGQKLSDSIQGLYPMNKESSSLNNIETHLSYHVFKYVDRLPNAKTIRDEDAVHTLFKYDNSALSFYDKHKADAKPVAEPRNVEYLMEEMFRLGERMSRNSRMSGPMKELCGKIRGLKKDYASDPEKYRTMPQGHLKNLFSSVMHSADAYINDKKNLKSFSSTQLERLKCINQLKSLQDSLTNWTDAKEFSFGSFAHGNDELHTYSQIKLAEKLVLHNQIHSKNGAALCDYEKIKQDVQTVLESKTFRTYTTMLLETVRERSGKSIGLDEEVIPELLKLDGQALLRDFQSYTYTKHGVEIEVDPAKPQRKPSPTAEKVATKISKMNTL